MKKQMSKQIKLSVPSRKAIDASKWVGRRDVSKHGLFFVAENEAKYWYYSARVSGWSSVRLECGLCKTPCTAKVWVLSGSGKRCPGCGAILSVREAHADFDRIINWKPWMILKAYPHAKELKEKKLYSSPKMAKVISYLEQEYQKVSEAIWNGPDINQGAYDG